MMGITRIIIGIVCFGIILSIFNKYNMFNERKRRIVCFIISIVFLPSIMSFIPFENFFISFDTAEDVYTYINGKEDIKLTIEGNNSDLVIGYKKGVYTHLIIPKTEKGYKIGSSFKNRRIVNKIIDENSIYIKHYKNTNDYYITVYKMSGKVLDITDSSDSKFYSLEKEALSTETKKFITYYAHIEDFDSNYWISIDNKKINLLEK